MADKFMKVKDVEKEKRLKYLWDYYKVPFLVFVIILVITISVIKTIFFPIIPDSYVFMVSANNADAAYIMEDVGKILEENIKDFNKDGKTVLEYTQIPLTDDREITPDMNGSQNSLATKFSAILTVGNHIIEIADAESFDYLKENHLVADWSVVEKHGFNTNNKEGLIKVPLKETVLGKVSTGSITDNVFITIRPDARKSDSSEKGQQNYKIQLEYFLSLLK